LAEAEAMAEAGGSKSAEQMRAALEQSVAAVRARSALIPEIAIILGTGLGGLGAEVDVETAVPYLSSFNR
jgi:hypothetical protein